MTRNLSAWLAGAAFSAVAFTSANAADLPYRSRAPFYTPPPVFTWAGVYVGANASMNIGQFSEGGANYFGNAFGGLYGVTAGYNYQAGALVAGVEADLDFGSVNGMAYPIGGVHSSGNITGDGSLRARFGYAFDRALLYITGGYTGASMRGSLADLGTPNIYAGQSNYLNGFVVGGGLEYSVTNNVSLKAEYLFNDYGSTPFFSGTRDSITSGVSFSTIRAGVNYHF